MDFYINKDYFGTDFHLICYENGNTVKVYDDSEVPSSMLSVYSRDALNIANLYGFKILKFPSYKYRKFFIETLKVHKNNVKVPWQHVLPEAVYRSEIKSYVKHLKSSFHPIEPTYYKECFVPQNKIFDDLQPAKINSTEFMKIMSEQHDAHLRTFTPNSGFTAPIRYSRFSRTGRLKVESGPMINNLTKGHRHIIESRFANGEVYQFDFSSLEPRIFLAIKNINNPEAEIPSDVYRNFLEEYDLDIPRNVLKTAILSRLFGAGSDAIESTLRQNNCYVSSDDLIEMIDEYLGVAELKDSIMSQFDKNTGSKIFNFYGRPINCEDVSPHKLLNYYIQSTAVDVCLFGFNEIVRRIKLAGIYEYVVPVFILHDALFIDIHPDYVHLKDKLCKAGSLNIPKFEKIDFCLKAEKLV